MGMVEILITSISVVSAIVSLIFSIIEFRKTKNNLSIKINNLNKDIEIRTSQISEMIKFLEKSEDNNNSNKLQRISNLIIQYFKNISQENEYSVNIYKIKNGCASSIYASERDDNCNSVFIIKNNTHFFEAQRTKNIYYINDINYFTNQGLNYVTESKSEQYKYQSFICCPIKKQENVIGFINIQIKKPLNDLIDTNIIIDFLKKVCEIITSNNILD